MQFLLSNEQGITFPPLSPTYQEGELFFNRFRALVPRDARDSIIGEGGTGLIHLVRDELMERIVALKLPHESILRDPSARFDVIRETRQAIELTHPHIVRIHDFHEGREGWGISMQYVRGMNIDEWRHVGRIGPRRSIVAYPVDQIIDWVSQLCEALIYAHEDARMVHRDIKPKNLMLETREDGTQKLLLTDFGITQKLRLHTMMLSRTQPGMNDKNTMGTLPYMPWEQIQGSPASTLDDVYAVGATIYELLTGRPPFHEGGYEQIRSQIETVLPPPMAERLAEFDLPDFHIPREWEDTVAACLSKRPEDRPQSIRDIASRLMLGVSPLRVAAAEHTQIPRISSAEAEADNTQILALTTENREASAKISALESELSGIRVELDRAVREAADWKQSLSAAGSGSEELTRQLMELQSALRGRDQDLEAAAAAKEALERRAREIEGQRDEHSRRLSSLEAELENARLKAGEANNEVVDSLRKEIEAAKRSLEESRNAIATEKAAAGKAIQDAELAARKHSEQAAGEARNAREELEKSRASQRKIQSQLADMQTQKFSPLRQAAIVLIACLVLGAGIGIMASKLGGAPAESGPTADLAPFSRSIPSSPSDTGSAVTAGLFREYLIEQSIPEQEHGNVVPGIDGLDDDAPVTSVPWWTAEQFCAWLTGTKIPAGERAKNQHYRIATRAEVEKSGGTRNPEWVSDPPSTTNGGAPPSSRGIIGNTDGADSWQIPSSPRTTDGKPIGFRVTLQKGR